MSGTTTPADVLRWIVEANTGRTRRRAVRLTAEDDEVTWIARFVNAQREQHDFEQNPTGEVAAEFKNTAKLIGAQHLLQDCTNKTIAAVLREKIREVQAVVRTLTVALPPVLEAYERGGDELVMGEDNLPVIRPSPAWVALTRLLEAARVAHSIIGDPPPPGRPSELWTVWAHHLVPLVRNALVNAGRSRVSLTKAEGPLVKVICRALHAIDGEQHSPEKVASGLRRRR